MIKFITQKGCVTTVTTNMEELRSHGIVVMINYMQLVCVKTAILITTIEKEEKTNKLLTRETMNKAYQRMSRINEV